MKKAAEFTIQSEDDLEVILLYETHKLLAEIISDEYHSTNGRAFFLP